MSMKYDVFISHSSNDKKDVDNICKYLEENGVRCFLSFRDIPKGVSYPGEITRAMRDSEMLLLILSTSSNESSQVDKEITMASDQNKKLFCFRLENIQYSDDKAYLMSGVNWLDAFPNIDEQYFELLKNICNQLGKPLPERNSVEDNEEIRSLRLGTYLTNASAGDSESMFLLGQSYKFGWNDLRQDDQMAFMWYQKAAEKCHSESMKNLGVMYQYGQGVQRNVKESLKWYIQAASYGDENAQCCVGNLFCYGEEEIPVDYNEAIKWYKLSANYGYGPAQIELGRCYYYGRGVEPDMKMAADCFRKAAEQDNDEAQRLLSVCYSEGIGVEQSNEERLVWLQKSADNRNVDALVELADIYFDGIIVEKDDSKAFQLDQLIAEINPSVGCWRLVIDYRDGIGCESSLDRAREYLFKSANQNLAEAQNSIGVFYEDGDEVWGFEKDFDKAYYWYSKAAKNGHGGAMANCGRFNEFLYEDKEKALDFYKQSSEVGDMYGQYTMARKYLSGDGVERNEEMAVELFKQASEQGLGEAMGQLGICYYYGIGCEQDFNLAVEWLTKGMENNYYADADTLASCYEFGYGVEIDISKAISLYQKVIQIEEERPGSAVTEMAHKALVRLGVETND